MKAKLLTIAVTSVLIAACSHQQDDSNNTLNVDENLTTTDMNATDMNAADADMNAAADMDATDMNASGSDTDVPAPPPPPAAKRHRPK